MNIGIDQGIATVFAAIIISTPSIFGYLKGRQIHTEVKTLNESTIGELSADAETRRIRELPYDDRTQQEQRHLREAPEEGPPQGPPI